ncbi:MAG: hypothetical protein M9887_09165 [Chitinophagales bacterium]|nr:hypothetical protein [Chitinophagales bacterium]
MEFSPQDSIILEELLVQLKPLGFDIQSFGKNTFVVHGLPIEYEGNNIQSVIETMLHHFKESSTSNFDSKIQLAASLVKGISMDTNNNLDIAEIKVLIDELFACENPNYTIDGKKIYITFSLDDLEQQFS